MVYVKNYIQAKSNLRIQLLDNFSIVQDNFFQNQTPARPPTYGNSSSSQSSSNNLAVRLTQIDETVNVQEFEYTKVISLFPKMGQSNILQYTLEGNFSMLPVKLYPTFVARQDFNKLEMTLKANCRLPANLRVKEMRISFRAPESILRVFVHQKQAGGPAGGQAVNAWQDVTNLPSLVSYAGSYVESANTMMAAKKPAIEEADRADFNVSKRRVEWVVKNFRGGQNR